MPASYGLKPQLLEFRCKSCSAHIGVDIVLAEEDEEEMVNGCMKEK